MFPLFRALLTPWGRLPRWEYTLTILPLMALTWIVRGQLAAAAEPSALLQVAVFVPVWLNFCATSRRLQDINFPGVLCFPAFAAMAVELFVDINPQLSVAGIDQAEPDLALAALLMLAQLTSEVAMLFAAGFGGLMLARSSDGDNAYGPPFGTPAAAKPDAAQGPSWSDLIPDEAFRLPPAPPAPAAKTLHATEPRRPAFGRR